jgi:hypothetical protein
MELVSLKQMPREAKVALLKELGFDSDGTFVLDANGEQVLDKYIEQPVKLDNMLILPGSTVIIDNNPLSIAAYFEEFGEVF